MCVSTTSNIFIRSSRSVTPLCVFQIMCGVESERGRQKRDREIHLPQLSTHIIKRHSLEQLVPNFCPKEGGLCPIIAIDGHSCGPYRVRQIFLIPSSAIRSLHALSGSPQRQPGLVDHRLVFRAILEGRLDSTLLDKRRNARASKEQNLLKRL